VQKFFREFESIKKTGLGVKEKYQFIEKTQPQQYTFVGLVPLAMAEEC
jgi:hypothetical protein